MAAAGNLKRKDHEGRDTSAGAPTKRQRVQRSSTANAAAAAAAAATAAASPAPSATTGTSVAGDGATPLGDNSLSSLSSDAEDGSATQAAAAVAGEDEDGDGDADEDANGEGENGDGPRGTATKGRAGRDAESSPEVELSELAAAQPTGANDGAETAAAHEVHPDESAKANPRKQPAPARRTQGGKGKAGEEAVEHAVAAREEVERRRVEALHAESNGLSRSAGAKDVAGEAGKQGAPAAPASTNGAPAEETAVKVKQEEEVRVEGVADEVEDLPVPTKRERPAITEERARVIQFVTVTNDGDPRSLIILTGLKNIFQKQLPKMPREYIARLVFDRNHASMAIVKRGLQVVGGITYRLFEKRSFAEIVFCAITGTEQVKGYGSHLMNHLKDSVAATSSCRHFLTYADNYAIGYFKKQGFTKEIGLDRSVWAGYIKDYEGGTIMHCKMLPRIRYLDVSNTLARQKEVIVAKIKSLSQSHVVHPGLDLFRQPHFAPDQTSGTGDAEEDARRAAARKLDPSLVPGLKESGWTPEMDELTRRPSRPPQYNVMRHLLTDLQNHPSSWAFARPVNKEEVTDYYDVIEEPMDLETMEYKLESNVYKKLDDFLYDAGLIWKNCRAYNDESSNYVKNANRLERYLNEQLKVYL